MANAQDSKTVLNAASAKASRPKVRKTKVRRNDPYSLGCIAGEEAAQEYYSRLMERPPGEHGGLLARLVLDGLQIPCDHDDAEASNRRGWLVGLCFALECRLYEDTKHVWGARQAPRTPIRELVMKLLQQSGQELS